MSRAELSLEISRLVSRVMKGEALDTAACGDDLALRFPDAGLTGSMIAEAIDSAAGMVGLIRQGEAEITNGADESMSLADDGRLTATLDEELRQLADEQDVEAPAPNGNGSANGNGAAHAAPAPSEAPPARSAAGIGAIFARNAAAVRRAFSRG